jgi:SAM-dependent methyltransferase
MALSLVGLDVESSFYNRLVAEYGTPVLVLGSAVGQVIDALGERGHAVVGIEPSLRWASAARERLKGQPQVTVERADFLTFSLKKRFPLVIAPHNSFSWASSQGALGVLLDRVAKHLTREGVLAFEVRGLVSERSAQVPPRAFCAHFLERSSGEEKSHTSLLRLRRPFLTSALLEQALEGAGFQASERYRDFTGQPWDEGDLGQVGVAALK